MSPIRWGFMGPERRKETPVSEDEQVEDWSDPETGYRIDRFSELGFSLFESLELAVRKCDWHEAERLLKRGAMLEDVFEILR